MEHALDEEEGRYDECADRQACLAAIGAERGGRPLKQCEDHRQPGEQPQMHSQKFALLWG